MANEWTVPEAGDIEVLFRYTDATGARVTKGFKIPANIARALNQFCLDNGRVDADGVPDTLGLFAEHSYGKINADGRKAPGLVMTIMDRYSEYPGMKAAAETAAEAEASAAKAKLAAAQAAAAAAALQPIEEDQEPIA